MITPKFSMVQPMLDDKTKSSGFIALVAVLVLGAVGVSVGISLILLGLGSSRTAFALEQSNQAKALANACAEEALQKIMESTSFSGSSTISLGNGSCTYTVSVTGQSRLITTSSTVGTIIRKVKIRLTIHPQTLKFNIASWQEVADL